MLSVSDGRSRARSKSRERSRTREVRAPSPAARAPPPPTRRSKQAYESDSEEVSEDDVKYARYKPDDRYDDRKRSIYEDDRDRDRRRRGYDDSDEDDKRSSRYAKPSKYENARPDPGRHDSYSRGQDKDYEPPGAFKDYDERETRPRGGERYSISSPTEESQRPHSGSISSRGGMYSQPSKYEYAKAPSDVRYVAKGPAYTAAPAERGPSYTAKPPAEIEVERRRHRRDKDDEDEELERQYAEIQRLKKKKEADDTELIRKYEKEIEQEKKKKESERKQIKYKGEASSDEDDYKPLRRKLSDDDNHKPLRRKLSDEDDHKPLRRKQSDEEDLKPLRRKYSDEDDHKPLRRKDLDEDRDRDIRRKEEVLVSKKYKDPEPKEIRPSSSRHGSLAESQTIEIRPRENSSALKPLESGVRRLSVSAGAGSLSLMAPGGHHGPVGGGKPPGSPLLEAYHGTYQSISPMPSPMALPSMMDDGLSDLEPLEGDYGHSHAIRPKKTALRKRVEIYDPEADAKIIGKELESRKPSAACLIKVLPTLSDDNMMALRTEYKKHFKSQGKGINVAKHIKVKFTGNIGKIAYATSLGRWESEAHWANFWYQAGSSRRELLIESLLGRTNSEIRKIKDAFSDKRYNDSLEKCMQTELKKDKFRYAVLLALEEKRMDEIDPVRKSQVRVDVDALYKALVAREGGETAMIDIIVVRSDNHLREVLKDFEVKYKTNFARQMIAKSQNLVGETLAHILNGVLNKPVRDALLLHQALAETAKDRMELIMSRLIRYHWEPKHLERVKIEYKSRYKTSIESDIRQGFTKGEFSDFCVALCEGAVR